MIPSAPRLYLLNTETREYRAIDSKWMKSENWELLFEEGDYSYDATRAIIFHDEMREDDSPARSNEKYLLVADCGYENSNFHASAIKAYIAIGPREPWFRGYGQTREQRAWMLREINPQHPQAAKD